jgi:tetratricopeptide (TPR) repeat protein
MTDPTLLYTQLVAEFRRCNWHGAQDLASQLLPHASRHAGVYGMAGVVSLELKQLPQAVEYLHKATSLDPARADFATLHAKALSMSRRMGDAVLAADRALAITPIDSATLDTLGVIYTQANAHAQAAAAFERAVALAPNCAPYRFNLATSLLVNGEIEAAEFELETCIRIDPQYLNPHLPLAHLRRQTPERNHVARLTSLLSRHAGDAAAQLPLNMALAKEYEDLADYSLAFDHLIRGKSVGRQSRPYSIERDENLFAGLMRTFPLPQPVPPGNSSNEPVFIVGMPRSGTTLVERILSSHSEVYAAGELQNFAWALQDVSGAEKTFLSSQDLASRTLQLPWERLGATYLSSTRPFTAGTPHFIDKLPHNFLYVGFIAHALPNARIICLRRDPMDTCLGNFRQLFEHASPHFDYSFDLLDIGRYYVLFDRLMNHWKQAFPGRILEVGYEALVSSPESGTRQLLDFCGLGWQDACLRFEENRAPAATFSSVQVRQPFNCSSIQRWKNYGASLDGLLDLLTKAGIVVTS